MLSNEVIIYIDHHLSNILLERRGKFERGRDWDEASKTCWRINIAILDELISSFWCFRSMDRVID